MGQRGRTATLHVRTSGGYSRIEENGRSYDVGLAESMAWLRRQFAIRWFEDVDILNDGFWLWLGMLEGLLEQREIQRRRKGQAMSLSSLYRKLQATLPM